MNHTEKTRKWMKRVGAAAGLTAVAVGAIGVLHMPLAKPLLMALGGCPVGKVSPSVVESSRRDAVLATRGTVDAAARPALGFALDEMTLTGVQGWAKRTGVDCVEKREGTLLQCHDVPASALSEGGQGALDDVSFGFTVEGKRLVNITTLRSNLAAHEAASRMAGIAVSLEQKLGAPTRAAGDRNADYLASVPFATATIEYRFRDYMADVTSTAVPGRGVVLREQYMSARM